MKPINECLKCGYVWEPTKSTLAKQCPKCNHKHWWAKKTTKKILVNHQRLIYEPGWNGVIL